MIPVYKPWLTDLEKKYVLDAYNSGWISSQGPYIERFEKAFAEYIGVKHAIAVNNGTAACHLAMVALGIGPGDEVIIPAVTFIATANAITYCGGKPVLCDIARDSWNIDSYLIESLITEKTKAIMPVHLYGVPANMFEINKIAKKYNLAVVEDACEALGAEIKDTKFSNKYAGSFSDISVFSFFGNKTITAGEGGMVCTDNDYLAELVRLYKGQGQGQKRYYHEVVGYNYRMTNIQAALGLAQLERIDEILKEKARIYEVYYSHLNNLWPVSDFLNTQLCEPGDIPSDWLFSYLTEDRDELIIRLRDNEIDSRPVFYPINKMPPYSDLNDCPIANFVSERGLSLPSYPELTDSEINRIIGVIRGR